MKVWRSYGSEHSMNLVMIGRFQKEADARETKDLLDKLFDKLPEMVDFDVNRDRYSDDVLEFLNAINLFALTPTELVQFRYDISVELLSDEIRVTTDEDDVSGIIKVMLQKGAKIEVFSAHDYPEGK
tara:strand:- start:6805 stop:7185 length:381 start_codon:yes stop_codon:yes gene_type:complete